VQPIGAGVLRGAYFLGETAKVGGENGWGDRA
jgi:hypothetical protein